MAPGEVETIRTTDQMVILREKRRLSWKLLIRAAVYDTVQQRTIIPIQETKAAETKMRKRIIVRMPNRYEEEDDSIMNPYSSYGIHVTS